MENEHLFPRTELIRYRQVTDPKPGNEYLLVMAYLSPKGSIAPGDYALCARRDRDGMTGFRITEDELRRKRSDADLCWILNDEKDGQVSLYSPAAKKYVTLEEERAYLSRKKFLFRKEQIGSMFRLRADGKHAPLYLRIAVRNESASGLIFTSGQAASNTVFGIFERVRGLSAETVGKPKVTVGTLADIHTDYRLQSKRPYHRRGALQAAKAYRNRYDLDAIMVCGDHTSDNASWFKVPFGAEQGEWDYETFLRSRAALDNTLHSAFRDPKKANILYVSGNHEYQCGDRQPAGKTYSSAYYDDLLPKDVKNRLTEPFPTDLSDPDNLMCYSWEKNGVDFLLLNTPLYPVIEGARSVCRRNPAHNAQQADWLEKQLERIRKAKGRDAVIFVATHYPFEHGCFAGSADFPDNYDVYLRMEAAMNRFPNLFLFYGHSHHGDFLECRTHTGENMVTRAPYEYSFYTREDGARRMTSPDAFARCRFTSDALLANGFHEEYAGSLSFYYTNFFKNDGKKFKTDLTQLEVPFSQGCVIEVYDDRVVLTMQNFGTRAGTALLPDSTYKLRPLICPLRKTENK